MHMQYKVGSVYHVENNFQISRCVV